jgi:hypothetical protein
MPKQTEFQTSCNRLQLVATGRGNRSLRSSSVAVAVAANREKIRTGRGLVAPKKGKKTGPDRTFKHYEAAL